MSKIDDLYTFRLATVDDVDAIMTFYKEEWQDNHILANDKDFFLYQHGGNGNVINFVLAINKTTNEIEAAEGFIQYSEELIDVAGVMWKTKANVKVPFLGVEVVKRLKKLTGCRVYLGVGANPITAVPLHKKMLKHNICKMNHFYKLMEKEHYNIAIINEKRIFVNKKNDKYDLVEITEIGEIKQSYFEEQKQRRPYKDSWYIDRRYFQHPIYQYKVWKITKIGEILAVIIAREIDMAGVKVLRIIDFFFPFISITPPF